MRTAVGVNGGLPVPPVYADEGDTLFLHVHNSLNFSISVHAHGLLQLGTNFMDGAAMVTQCGIPPNASFTYELHLNQTGTYWLHGHDEHETLADGLRTPLVIRDRQSPYEYDDEYLLTFEDWYAIPAQQRVDMTLDPTKPFPPPPSFPYALINGVNANHTKALAFEPGKTYRIRLINMATTEWFKFSMPGHEMHVIEADGVYSEPYLIDGLSMGPAQRYSVLVTAHSTNVLNYQYLVELYASFIPRIPGMNPRYYSGTVEYAENAPVLQADKETALEELPEDVSLAFDWDIQLRALERKPALPVTRTVEVVIGGALFSDGVTRDIMNNISYVPPRVPTLYTALSLGALARNASLYGPRTNVVVIDHLEHVELVIQNPSHLTHPMHLHMTNFQIVEYGPVSDRVLASQGQLPLKDPAPVRTFDQWPMERDTVVLLPMQYVKVRFRASSIGAWHFHCHLPHMAFGMRMTFVVAPELIQQYVRIPDAMYDMCRQQGIPISGNGAGNPGADMSGLPDQPQLVSF
ncbi:ferroxidase fet3 [Coemansia sp. RSA 2618]|nr:ferroxidase fet3 [Coemansia sp. RSA 2618]